MQQKYKNCTEYWLDTTKMTFRGDFEHMYRDLDDPWGCESYVDSFNNTILVELIMKQKNNYSKILDIGCGLGGVLNRITQRYKTTAVGYDISPTAVAKASQKFPHIDFRVKNILTDEIEEKGVDLILLSEICWYVLDNINSVFNKLFQAIDQQNGLVVIHQSFPKQQNFGGDVIDGVAGFINFIDTTKLYILEKVLHEDASNDQVLFLVLGKR